MVELGNFSSAEVRVKERVPETASKDIGNMSY
jgi:hypothetical protein